MRTMRKRVPVILRSLLITGMLLSASCDEETSQAGGRASIASGFESGTDGFAAYRGSVSAVQDERNAKVGSGALKWTYKIEKGKVNFIAKGNINAAELPARPGVKLWLKSDKPGPLLFQLVERGGGSYQYLSHAQRLEADWKSFTVPFDRFEKDADVKDDNNRLDLGAVKEFWIIDAAGHFDQSLVGPRTVWIDDLQLLNPSSGGPQGRDVAADEGVVLPAGRAGEIDNLKSDPFVLKDDGLYKMWYGANSSGAKQQVFYATSKDGKTWSKQGSPVISLGGRGEWDAADIETPTVVKVGDAYHLWYCGRARDETNDTWTPESAYKIGHATSGDGIRWRKDPANPVITLGDRARNDWNWAAAAEPTVVYEAPSTDRRGAKGTFHMWYVGGNVLGGKTCFHIGYATSTNGSQWKEHAGNPILRASPASGQADYVGYFCPSVMKHGGRYIMLYVTETWNGQPIGPIRYGTSSDGIRWTMSPTGLLAKGQGDSWKGSGIFAPTAVIEGGQLKLWYTGFLITTRFAFGLGHAELPADRLKMP